MSTYTGVVQKGLQRAKALGYPTINIPLEAAGIDGIYAATVQTERGSFIAAAFADSARGILEAHMLDHTADLYGTKVAIELHEKLRDSAMYASDAELKEAIAGDIAKVREYFKN